MNRVVMKVTCAGCFCEREIRIQQVQVERGEVQFPCESCGTGWQFVPRATWQALAAEFDRPGGTIVSDREANLFRLKSRRFEHHMEREGLACEEA